MLRPLPPSCALLKDLSAGLLHPFTTQVTPFSTFSNLLTRRSTLSIYNIPARLMPLLNKLSATLDSAFLLTGRGFSKLGVTPTGWTFVGLSFALLSALAYGNRGSPWQPLAGLLVLASGFFDIVDGAVARATGRMTKRGAFLDLTLDRLREVAICVGMMVGGYSSPDWVLVAITFSLLVSYTRARGEALGIKLSGVGIGERSERLLILAVLSIVGLASYGVLVVAVVAIPTFLQGTGNARVNLSKEGSGGALSYD